MSPKDFVAKTRRRFQNSPIPVREALLTTRIVLHDLSEDLHCLRLADGQRVNDYIAFTQLLREIEQAIEAEVSA